MDVVDKESFDVEVLQSRTAVLVDVWGPKCVPCLQLMPAVEKMEGVYGDSLKIVKLNSAENRRFCIEYGIMGLPTFMLFVDGKEIDRISGQQIGKSDIEELVGKGLE